jgi:hypothetical protein
MKRLQSVIAKAAQVSKTSIPAAWLNVKRSFASVSPPIRGVFSGVSNEKRRLDWQHESLRNSKWNVIKLTPTPPQESNGARQIPDYED